jgi:hypothetical protein
MPLNENDVTLCEVITMLTKDDYEVCDTVVEGLENYNPSCTALRLVLTSRGRATIGNKAALIQRVKETADNDEEDGSSEGDEDDPSEEDEEEEDEDDESESEYHFPSTDIDEFDIMANVPELTKLDASITPAVAKCLYVNKKRTILALKQTEKKQIDLFKLPDFDDERREQALLDEVRVLYDAATDTSSSRITSLGFLTKIGDMTGVLGESFFKNCDLGNPPLRRSLLAMNPRTMIFLDNKPSNNALLGASLKSYNYASSRF